MLIVPISFNSNSSFKLLKEKSILKQVIKEFLSIYYKKQATQEKVACCFSFGVTVTYRLRASSKL